jgi:hypothetical protein
VMPQTASWRNKKAGQTVTIHLLKVK